MFRGPVLGSSIFRIATLAAISLSSLHAASFSFEGSFTSDDDLRFFTFNVAAPSSVTLLTWSYAGGTNDAGDTIARGGFDPVLSLFTGALDPAGLQIGANNDGTCPPLNTDAVTGACWDSQLLAALTPGLYTLVLSQNDNSASGPTLGDGFLRSGEGNFTGPAFLGQPGAFVDQNGNQRDGHWAVDILNVESASEIPEPSSALLVGSVALLFSAGYSRRRAAR